MPSATDGTCVITGASSGIGLEAARQLAAAGLKVVGIGRAPETCRLAEMEIRSSSSGADVRIIAADLSSMGNVRRAAAGIRDGLPGGRLDRLIHAEATVTRGYTGTEDGYELQFALNYLAAFLLTHELFPALIRPGEARVIAVSSGLHRGIKMAWDDPMLRRRYSGLRAYRQSKLALVLFIMELNRRAACRFPVRAIGVQLGPFDADGGKTNSRLSAADAATAIVRLATDPASSIAGDYWRLGRPIEPGPYARSPEAARRLWRLSEELCGVDFLGPAAADPALPAPPSAGST